MQNQWQLVRQLCQRIASRDQKRFWLPGGGLLVDVGNSDKLAEAIEQVLDNTELRKQLIKEGKDRVKNFEINNIVKQYEEVIDEVFWG